MSHKRILMIDDELDILQTTQYALQAEGYEVYTAVDGKEGLQKLKEVKPDVILLDLLLPGESGFQIAQQIRAMDEYKNIPIIVLSGKKELSDKYIAIKSGVVEYLEKPIDIDKLIYHVRDLISV